MNATTKRWIAYPVASAVAGALVWYCYIRPVDAEYMTLLGSAQLQAGLASGISADTTNADGKALRAKLLADANDWLDRAERAEPGAIETAQLRAWIVLLEGDHAGAARQYQAIHDRPDCSPELKEQTVQNMAKVWSIAGDHQRGLAVLDRYPPAGEPSIARQALRVRLEFKAGQPGRARDEAVALAAGDSEDARLTAAVLLESMGEWQSAEAAYRRTDGELRDYRLARLKLRAGETDTAVELLDRAVAQGERASDRPSRPTGSSGPNARANGSSRLLRPTAPPPRRRDTDARGHGEGRFATGGPGLHFRTKRE